MSLVRMYSIMCDGCGEQLDVEDPRAARVKAWAREEGWTLRTRLPGAGSNHVKGDICPACLELRKATR